MRYPLIAPNPPRLSERLDALRRVEASGIFSNGGPEVRAFEAEATQHLFGGHGASLAVANATLGLMIALRDAMGNETAGAAVAGRFALMPALTFAATAQAALWAGLTPLICDIDPADWGASAAAEEQALAEHGARIAVVLPYATFGNAIDLERYARLRRDHGVGVVIDAAASLGTLDERGAGFGANAPFACVYSMHATKTFAVAEGGLIHSGDTALIGRLRAMTNFGFEAGRSATLPGINAKLPELIAVMARARLGEIDAVCDHRAALEQAYRARLDHVTFQQAQGRRRASQFMPVLLPERLAAGRDAVAAAIAAEGVGTGRYFSPHLGEQPLFRDAATILPTPVADDVAARTLSLPITDAMTVEDVGAICRIVNRVIAARLRTTTPPARAEIAAMLLVGGGPAGTALLTAASKRGRLGELAAAGLVIAERGAALGDGRLGRYAITSDSTAETFLSAVKDNPHPELAALGGHPAGQAVARHIGARGVPLVEAGAFVRETARRLQRIVTEAGGSVLAGHDVLHAARTRSGLWSTRLRRRADGHEFDRLSHAVTIATGGHQPLDRLAGQCVGGVALVAELGDRLIQSDEALALGGPERIVDLLSKRRDPRIVVIGGSTSAIATIVLLLKTHDLPLGAGAVTLLHRRPLRPFYPTPAAAAAEGFDDFGPDDICPVSGFVYRLAGFRLEARDLVLRQARVDGRVPDPRVVFHQ